MLKSFKYFFEMKIPSFFAVPKKRSQKTLEYRMKAKIVINYTTNDKLSAMLPSEVTKKAQTVSFFFAIISLTIY